ncbi:hypothetical protein BSKO_03573 [Bryopsis sp. KO-2023]|nr:hypothetical protein BSKO_03573 [Bryopsis sp. KO-2023]
MVLLHVKRSDDNQFLYKTTIEASVKKTVEEMVKIHNLRQRIHRLKMEGEELAKYGPAKHPEKQGIDTYSEGVSEVGDHYEMDPTGRRTGNACDPKAAKTLLKTLEEAKDVASKDQVAKKIHLTIEMLEAAVDNIRGAVMICYPMGLPEWDFVRLCLEGNEKLGDNTYGSEDLDGGETSMWFAGKVLLNDNKLRDHLGRHENTRAVIKLTKKGQGAPGREPIVDADTQKAMMSWYHKKQEQQKKLEENEEDDYFNSSWANQNSLKQHFSGVSQVKIPR